jgi:hypothetical protein
MKILRYLMGCLIVIMGLARLRIILLLLVSPSSYTERDILQEYLMGKALLAGINPYLPLNELAEKFIGQFPYLLHPSPHPPFIAFLSIPFTILRVEQVIIAWFIIEMLCLLLIAEMLIYLWKGQINLRWTIFVFFLLLAWYTVYVDLLYGQLTLLLAAILLGILLALRKDKKILAGALTGLTIAIKMFTWPLILYYAIKKDWRIFISSCMTVIGLNLIGVLGMGIGPVLEYYMKVTFQVSALYHSFLKNYSLWSIGYRFFAGTRPIGEGYVYAPPLVYLPKIAPYISAVLAITFLIIGLIWATRSRNKEIAYSILILVIVVVSPISWDHYYVLITISMAVLLLALSRASFPNWPTILYTLIVLMLFLFNEHISEIMLLINGGANAPQGNVDQISFASSLLELLPIVQVVGLTFLLWNLGRKK